MTTIIEESIEFTPLINPTIRSNNNNKNNKKELTDNDWKCIHNIITRDFICDITEKEKLLMWRACAQLVSMCGLKMHWNYWSRIY